MKSTTVTIKEPILSNEDGLYVRCYINTLNHDKAYKLLHPDAKGSYQKNKYRSKDSIAYHIKKHLIKMTETLSLDSDKILYHLYTEATLKGEDSSSASRIQALSLIGKALGMFESKKSESNVTYNIINYKSTEETNKPKEVSNDNLITDTK